MLILGISCDYHDAAAAVIRDGEILAAAEEERFTRRKHDARFPVHAARYCLEAAGVAADGLDTVIFYEKPLRKLDRILSSYAATFPLSRRAFVRAMQVWMSEKLWVRARIRDGLGYRGEVLFGDHHQSHAASAFYPSPFDESAVVTADGVGEWTTVAIGAGRGLDLQLTHELRYPHSLGLLYSAFTAYLGFEVNEGEYKVMGMAGYGRPRHADKVRRLIRLLADGSFRLDMSYFAFHRALRPLDRKLIELFGPTRRPEAELEQHYADVAASIQQVTEEAMLGIARRARQVTGSRNLCLAGGVALNVLANARILREAGFDDVWVQPAAGDSGGSLGAALHLYHGVLGRGPRRTMRTACLGPEYDDAEIDAFLDCHSIERTVLSRDQLPGRVARLLADGNVVGWFQGRMEFGPRALGARSILASPLSSEMKEVVNAKIKHREAFRPFAPSTLYEACHAFFDLDGRDAPRESPYMLLAARVRHDRAHLIPAVTHVDGTSRVQTVRREEQPAFYAVIEEFGKLTGVPVILNTSFNVRGEPIVRNPAEAFNSFSHTDMDYVLLGHSLVAASAKKRLGPYPGSASTSADSVVV